MSTPSLPARPGEIVYRGAGGQERRAILDVPTAGDGPLPLVLTPHPANWTAAENFHGGAAHTLMDHRGWRGIAERHGVIVVAPDLEGRETALTSLGYDGTLRDMVAAVEAVRAMGVRVDPERLYVTGVSMGGQEALLLLARFPGMFAAGMAFNAVVDLAGWYADLVASPHYADLVGEDPTLDELVRREIGGTPEEVPEAYAARSPLTYATDLTRTPLLLYWSHLDDIVPNQTTRQTKWLYDAIKARDALAPVAEFNHTWSHGYVAFDFRERWMLHEYNDYDLATRWLLSHRRAGVA